MSKGSDIVGTGPDVRGEGHAPEELCRRACPLDAFPGSVPVIGRIERLVMPGQAGATG